MKKINVKNTYNLNIKGTPDNTIDVFEDPSHFIINPQRISHFKAKLLVKVGESVKIGTPVLTDKKQPHLQFLSPAAGVIKDIEYGNRRVIKKIMIEKSENEENESIFSPLNQAQIENLKREETVAHLVSGGLWGSIIEFPFNVAPKPETVPPSIYVSIDYDEPFMPQSDVFLKENEASFLSGLKVLKTLSDKIYVGVSSKTNSLTEKVKSVVTHELEGDYPANHPGVFLYYNKTTSEENKSWGIRALDVIRIGQLFETGHYPTKRLVVISGALCKSPRYIKTREGVPLEFIKNETVEDEPVRIITGGVLTGDKVSVEDGLGYQEYSIHLIREGMEQELLSFFRPGLNKPSFSKTYMSGLVKRGDWEMTTSINGGHRACISCGICEKVCPVESSPQIIMKSLEADDLETAISYGLLDIVESGLYTYVCPSKIELDQIFRDAKEKTYQRLNA